ncbi:MAG: SBBP repeat-containing protein [Chromatiales bacterium]|nr:SBBP repeat-containing protein [Chromatiales bacterium]
MGGIALQLLAVDGQGNVLVTGKSAVNGIGFDYATLKYDPTGNLLWEQRYVGLGNGSMWNLPSALAVDRRGDVLVTGKSLGVTSYDIVTLKYGPDGNLLWGQRYDGSGNGDDEAYALVVTQIPFSVLVAGRSLNTKETMTYVILKYDPDGHLLWERRYDGSGNGDDEARAIAVDSLGNVYVTGLSVGSTGL